MANSIRPPAAIAVLGGGNMGSGIAQACAQAGFSVRVRDVDSSAIERGRGLLERMLQGAIDRKKMTPAKRDDLLGRIRFTTDLAEAVRDARLVIEAVFEDEEVKRRLFADLAPLVAPETIVATNTSSFSVSVLGEGFPLPGRFAGLHFFFPAAINKLVEIVGGPATDRGTLDELERFCYLLRKIPIETADRAGFCVNRYFVPLGGRRLAAGDRPFEGLLDERPAPGDGRRVDVPDPNDEAGLRARLRDPAAHRPPAEHGDDRRRPDRTLHGRLGRGQGPRPSGSRPGY